MIARIALLLLPLAAVGLGGAGPPGTAAGPLAANNARLVIMGNSQARACSDHAVKVSEGKMSPNFAVETCTEALNVENLTPYETAATHNNRGVVRMGMLDEAAFAIEDFDAAARIEPELGESYVNRGSVLMREDRFADAIVELDRGIALGLKEPWKAYFNRAVSKEAVGDVPGAYADYHRALETKPEWPPAMQELARFTVRRR
jgi:tetratricopeptide (TPR) repeat protein